MNQIHGVVVGTSLVPRQPNWLFIVLYSVSQEKNINIWAQIISFEPTKHALHDDVDLEPLQILARSDAKSHGGIALAFTNYCKLFFWLVWQFITYILLSGLHRLGTFEQTDVVWKNYYYHYVLVTVDTWNVIKDSLRTSTIGGRGWAFLLSSPPHERGCSHATQRKPAKATHNELIYL